MNNVVTIPKKLAEMDDLVVIPKREYRDFVLWRKAVRVKLDEQWFWTPEWQKKEAEADEAIRKGRLSGPFSSHKKLIASLKRKRGSRMLSIPGHSVRTISSCHLVFKER